MIITVGPLLVGTVALLLSILYLLPGRLTQLYRTEIMIALSLNAYFGGHVLLQVTLQRYAAAGTLAAIFLIMSVAATTAFLFKRALMAGLGIISDYQRRAA